MDQLRLSPPSHIPDGVVAGSGAAQKIQGVEDVGEWLSNTGHGLGVCKESVSLIQGKNRRDDSSGEAL